MFMFPRARLARTSAFALSAGALWCVLVGFAASGLWSTRERPDPAWSAGRRAAQFATLPSAAMRDALQRALHDVLETGLRAGGSDDASGTGRGWRRASTRRTLRSLSARVLASALPGNPLPSVSYPGGGACVRCRLASRGAIALRLLSAPTRAPPRIA